MHKIGVLTLVMPNSSSLSTPMLSAGDKYFIPILFLHCNFSGDLSSPVHFCLSPFRKVHTVGAIPQNLSEKRMKILTTISIQEDGSSFPPFPLGTWDKAGVNGEEEEKQDQGTLGFSNVSADAQTSSPARGYHMPRKRIWDLF